MDGYKEYLQGNTPELFHFYDDLLWVVKFFLVQSRTGIAMGKSPLYTALSSVSWLIKKHFMKLFLYS
jgi:hypothetical protein